MKKITRGFLALILGVLLCFSMYFPAAASTAQGENSAGLLTSSVFAKTNTRVRQISRQQTGTSAVSLPTGTTGSSNWAGYVVAPASGTAYTSVSGTWTIPDISGSANGSAAAQWIGLGGVSSTDLLQMGTIEYNENGTIVTAVFVEKLPDSAQYVVSAAAGSTIKASISKDSASDTQWNLTYTIVSPDNETVTDTVTMAVDADYASEMGTSAEWISEDPTNANGQLIRIANMGTVKYSALTVNGNALSDSSNTLQPVALVSGSRVVIAPSAVGSDGESFSTTMSENSSKTVSESSGSRRFTRGEFPGSRHMFDGGMPGWGYGF